MVHHFRTIVTIIVGIILFFSLSPVALAQVGTDSVFLRVTPVNPQPGDIVTITADSHLYNIDTATITWSLDNKVLQTGLGEKQITLELPVIDATTVIRADFILPGGARAQREIEVTPTILDIIWQATDSRVPPFYRGKALPSPQSEILFTAIPDSSFSNQSAYTWEQSGEVLSQKGGVGKSSIELGSSVLEQEKVITVTALDPETNRSVRGTTQVAFSSPKIVFYPIHSTGATANYSQALTSPVGASGLLQLEAFPLFFSHDTLESAWTINSSPVRSYENRTRISLSAPSSGTQATLSTTFNHPVKIFQTATASLDIFF